MSLMLLFSVVGAAAVGVCMLVVYPTVEVEGFYQASFFGSFFLSNVLDTVIEAGSD